MPVKDELQLIIQICNCPNIQLARLDSNHPCNEIVTRQDLTKKPFQLPEPWSGDLVNAPLLCIASNPSINPDECYPTKEKKIWNNELIIDFFQNRFSPESKWTKGRKVLLVDRHTYHRDSVKFWNNVNKQVERAFGHQVEMGVDYAITEVVHCKSEGEGGVKSCRETCSNLWMEKITNLSNARVLLLLGTKALDWFKEVINEPLGKVGVREGVLVGGRNRTVVWVPHPNAWVKKIMTEILTDEELQIVRRNLNPKSTI